MLDQLDAWATEEIPLPESRVPSRLFLQDYGPDFTQGFITHEPPRVDTTLEYAVLIPSVDADGNNIPGLCTPDITVPLATYTGWKLRAEGYGSQAMYSVVGSYIPFAATAAERQDRRDARPSLSERYRSKADYVSRVAFAVRELTEQGLLLAEDGDRYIEAAIKADILAPSEG